MENEPIQSQQVKVAMFSEDHSKIDFFENLISREVDLQVELDVCPIKISTEELFLQHSPDLIFVDFDSMNPENREYLMSKLERVSAAVPVVGIFSEDQKEEALKYVKRGMRDFVNIPLSEKEVVAVIHRFRKYKASQAATKQMGKAYTFFSFKGGVGNTFITLNTAVSMARLTKKRVLLWDMALQGGDIPFFLNFSPEFTFSNLTANVEQIDQHYLDAVLPAHPCGVSILAAPDKTGEIEKLPPTVFEQIVGLLLQHFDYIFIDGGYHITDDLLPLIDASAYLFITTSLELVSLRSSVRCLDVFGKLNYPADRIKIIVNRFNSKHEAISIEEAKKILKFSLVDFISNDYTTVAQSVNLGQPIADMAKGSELDKEFGGLAKKIESNFSEVRKEKRVIQRLLEAIKGVKHHAAS